MELDTKNLPTVSLCPQDIFYSTQKIRSKFNNGKRLHDIIEDIRTFRLAVSDFPWINVVKQGDQWISLNNRRLYVFRMAQVDEINCIDCTESEAALAELSTNLARFSPLEQTDSVSNTSSKLLTEREHVFSQLTQKWIDFIVQLDPEKLLDGTGLSSSAHPLQLPVSFGTEEEYSSMFYDFLRVEAAEKLKQSLQAASRASNSSSARDRYPGSKIQAQIVRYQPRAAKDSFKADIVTVRTSVNSRLGAAPRVHDCVHITWNSPKSPSQLGVVTFMSEDAGEIQIKLCMPSKTADSVDTMILRKEAVTVTVQCIDNVVTQMRVAAALNWPFKSPLFGSLLHLAGNRGDKIKLESLGDLEYWAESQRNYNASQMKALQAIAHEENKFLLIQGPPGTGKTSTIMGACASLLYQGKRVLITSPSNHAVDSIARMCLSEGLGPVAYKPPMSLVGAADSISLNGGLETIFTDTRLRLCVEILENYATEIKTWNAAASADLKMLLLRIQRDSALPSGIKRKLSALVSAMIVDRIQQDARKADFLNYCSFSVRTLRSPTFFDQWSRKLVRDSRLCFSTISSAGRSIVRESGRFDCIIVDEASQALEAETNVLFMLESDKIILVGDPAQLTGTVVSQAAKRGSFGRSLFERALQAGVSPLLLNVQYRMHDQIARFSNQHFYGGALQTQTSESDIHNVLKPLVFFDISGVELGKSAVGDGESLSNEAEAQAIGEIVHVLTTFHNGLVKPDSIGIITPYSAQTKLISSHLQRLFGGSVASQIEVNTVDGFQGREKEVIIVSFVRSNPKGQMGFVQDAKRLNVSLTRAKHSLICVGSHPTLAQADPRSPIPHFAKHVTENVVDLSSSNVVKDVGPIILQALFRSSPDEAADFSGRPAEQISKLQQGDLPNKPRSTRGSYGGGPRGQGDSSRGRSRGNYQPRGPSTSASSSSSKGTGKRGWNDKSNK